MHIPVPVPVAFVFSFSLVLRYDIRSFLKPYAYLVREVRDAPLALRWPLPCRPSRTLWHYTLSSFPPSPIN
ncbi:uncharacterized protein RAG0_14733 [Rhynchosporium agropyri]|uniref:Uncharacterized protein n=2 Tax=Rhynchosporium TaxID=38037 RepID=A0A1E1LI23_9HELO|nr:uncharacterized protein RCO7_14832 [Rhynchosporium commune]CZT10187.1 uncharacterized protein RAG0_14733 [Rhynchosporium agropyri]